MFKKKAPTYSAILIVYLVIVTLLRWPPTYLMGLFWLGAFLGVFIYNLDHLIYLYWQSSGDSAAFRLKQFITERRFMSGLDYLSETSSSRKKLVGHSVIFQSVLVVLVFFTLTSTSSFFGKGLAIGLFLYSIVNQGLLFYQGKDISSWFWQTEFEPSQNVQAFYYLVMVILLFYFTRIFV